MSIPYPKQTKAELVRLLIERDEALAAERSAHEETKATARAYVRGLRAKLAAAQDRQKYESMAYRAKLKKAAKARREAPNGESTFAERSAARKQAIAAYFAAHPDRKVVSDDELRAFCMEGVPA